MIVKCDFCIYNLHASQRETAKTKNYSPHGNLSDDECICPAFARINKMNRVFLRLFTHAGERKEAGQLRLRLNSITFHSAHPDTRSWEWRKKSPCVSHFSFKCSGALINTSLKAHRYGPLIHCHAHIRAHTHSNVKDMIWYNPPLEKKKSEILHQIILYIETSLLRRLSALMCIACYCSRQLLCLEMERRLLTLSPSKGYPDKKKR